MFEENSTIIGVMPNRKDKIKQKSRDLIETIVVLLVAGIFAYGFLSLLGLVLYLWWFPGVLITLLVSAVIIGTLLWKVR